MTLQDIRKNIDKKIEQNEAIIIYSYFELRVNVIYDLKEKQSQYNLPETIIINKNNFSIELTTENAEKNMHLGEFSFEINNKLLMAINKKIEELKEKDKNKKY